jgi:lipoate-protein ligase B
MIVVDLGVIDYDTALAYQYALHEKRVHSRMDDAILILEHPLVITIGRSGTAQDLLLPIDELAAKGVPVKSVGRGGKITCHYPGQLVAYPVMDLKRFNLDIPGFVHNLEETIIATLAGLGVKGERIEKLRGIFVGGDKIASIGVEVKQGVSMHGISLNVFKERAVYDYFVPCGIADRGIGHLECMVPCGTTLSMEGLKRIFLSHFRRIFGYADTEMLSLHELEKRNLLI